MTALNTRPRIDTDRVRSEACKLDYSFVFSDDILKWIGNRAALRHESQAKFRAKKVAKRQG
jgi:hypothetical protein